MALIYSPRADILVKQIGLAGGLGVAIFACAWYYYALPSYTRVGYMPEQPVPYSHAIHVGQLGMDCRYCHTHVWDSPHANVPATQTCMNCHNPAKGGIKANSALLAAARDSWNTGNPINWKRIHKVPEYAYFNHAVHVNRGVACVSCHGQINEMAVVWHDQELSMGWCLNCHRNAIPNLRPPDQVTNMLWKPDANKGETRESVGKAIHEKYNINPPQTCQGCHR